MSARAAAAAAAWRSARAALTSRRRLLIQPIQRLPRYELLLRELWKATPADEDGGATKEELRRALDAVSACVGSLNEDLEQAANARDLLAAQTELGMTDLVAPHRSFVRAGRLTVVSSTGHGADLTEHVVKAFLFSDCLILKLLHPTRAERELIPLRGAVVVSAGRARALLGSVALLCV